MRSKTFFEALLSRAGAFEAIIVGPWSPQLPFVSFGRWASWGWVALPLPHLHPLPRGSGEVNMVGPTTKPQPPTPQKKLFYFECVLFSTIVIPKESARKWTGGGASSRPTTFQNFHLRVFIWKKRLI